MEDDFLGLVGDEHFVQEEQYMYIDEMAADDLYPRQVEKVLRGRSGGEGRR